VEALKASAEINGAELVRRARAGDGIAWEDIVTAFSRRIFNLAYRFTSNVEAAEDLTQEVFIRVYRSLDQYDPKQGDLANWLMRLARNLIIDDYRHRQRNPQPVAMTICRANTFDVVGRIGIAGLGQPFQRLLHGVEAKQQRRREGRHSAHVTGSSFERHIGEKP